MEKSGKKFETVIIGGGIHGCSVALHLAKKGLISAVIEKDHVGRHASGVNAGGVRRLGRAFPEIPIAELSSKIWQRIENLTDDDCGFQPTGQVKVAENDNDLRKLKERVKKVVKMGFKHEEILSGQELHEYIPALANHCVGGLIVKGDGYADPFRTTQAFKRKATKLGVKFFESSEVISIKNVHKTWITQTNREKIFSKNIVNCTGAWGQNIAKALGDKIPILANALMLIITSPLPLFLDPVVGSESRALSFKQLSNGTVLIGGGYLGRARPDSNQTDLNFYQLSENVKSAYSLFPIIEKATIVRSWAGIEGFTPDNLPVIGPGQADGVFHAFGFSAHGFQMAPAVGKILSDLITNDSNEYSLDAFRADRFTNSLNYP